MCRSMCSSVIISVTRRKRGFGVSLTTQKHDVAGQKGLSGEHGVDFEVGIRAEGSGGR